MFGDEPVRLIQHWGGHFPEDELEPLGHCGDDGSGHLLVVEPGGTVGQGSSGARVPIELKCPVDGYQDVPNPLPIVHDDHAPNVSGATNETLADAHDFDPSTNIDGPLTRAVLAAQLSDACVDPEALESLDHDPGDHLEPLCNPGSWLFLRCGPGKCKCLLVEYGRPSPGETLDRPKPIGAGGADCLCVSRLDTIDGSKGHHRPRDVETYQTVDLATGDRAQCSVADGNVERRVPGIGIGDECVSAHNREDKEPAVTVSGSTPWLGIRIEMREPVKPKGSLTSSNRPQAELGAMRLGGNVRTRAHMATVLAAVFVLTACGDAPFTSLGQRSSGWIGEPTVVTTTTVATTVPIVVDAKILKWFNDELRAAPLDDPAALKVAVFARRAGDLFIQASRAEIAALLPESQVPHIDPLPVRVRDLTARLRREG